MLSKMASTADSALVLGQSGTLNNPLYKILLNHLGRRPWAVIL